MGRGARAGDGLGVSVGFGPPAGGGRPVGTDTIGIPLHEERSAILLTDTGLSAGIGHCHDPILTAPHSLSIFYKALLSSICRSVRYDLSSRHHQGV